MFFYFSVLLVLCALCEWREWRARRHARLATAELDLADLLGGGEAQSHTESRPSGTARRAPVAGG